MSDLKKQLFRVTVENVVYVVAETEMQAVKIAQVDAKAEWENAEVIARPVKPDIAYVDPDWRNSPPYGAGDDERTCSEWVTRDTLGKP